MSRTKETQSTGLEAAGWMQQLDAAFEARRAQVFARLGVLAFHAPNQAEGRAFYAAYLLESYAYVRHTSRILALAASRMEESHVAVRSFLFRHAVAEDRHHHMIVRDLKHLGLTAADAENHVPSAACQALVAYVYRIAGRENPVGILGDAYFLECMSLTSADDFADKILKLCDLPEKAVSFMRNHGKLDVAHVKSLQRSFAHVKRAEDQACVQEVLEKVGVLYADMIGNLGAVSSTRVQPAMLAAAGA